MGRIRNLTGFVFLELSMNIPDREHFSSLLDASPDPIWSISIDGLKLLAINRAAASAFGRSRESMLESDREWQLIIQEEDRVLLNDRFSQINTLQSLTQNFRILPPNSPPKQVQGYFRLVQTSDPSNQFIASTAQTVNSHTPTAQQNEDTLNIYDSLLESLPINVFRKDREGKIVFANNRYCSDLGLARELTNLIRLRTTQPTPYETTIRGKDMEFSSVIEWDRAFETVGGDKQLLRELMKVFIKDQESLVNAVRNAVTTEDGKELKLRAHSIKGALNHLGAVHSAKLAEALEEMGTNGQFTDAQNTFDEFVQTLRPVSHEMNKFISTNDETG